MRSSPVARSLGLALLAAGLSCCGDADLGTSPNHDENFSFETGWSDWFAKARDLTNPVDNWEVTRSSERASEGSQSVRLFLDNPNSQGKVWIERRYMVDKNQTYDVDISFDFATGDFGSANLWKVIASGGPDSPATAGVAAAQGDTGTGTSSDQGFTWLHKTFSVPTESDGDAELFVYVGVWGTWPFARTYYLDNVKVALTKR